jgi:hypothetical protein
MRIRARFSSVTTAVLLAAGLVSWPMAAAAAGQSDTEAGMRPERAAAFQMERTEAKYSPLALRLYGGFSRAEAADLNAGLDGYFEIFELYRAWGLGTITGGYSSPFRAGQNFGADLVLQLSRGFGIGIGAGYLRFSKSSLMTFSYESEDYRVSATPTLTAIPIRLGVFLTIPLAKWLNLTVNGGAEAYAALKLDARHRIDYPDGEWAEESLSASRRAGFDNLGFHGSLGFELMLSRNTGLFIEALGRYARLKNFEKATRSSRSGGGSETTEGRLYLESFTAENGEIEQRWDTFTVEETPPVSGTPSIVYSEPKVDLSGFSLQAGLRIRL